MKSINKKLFLLVAMVFMGVGFVLASCLDKSSSDASSLVQSEEILKTSKSWDGVDLPDYLTGKPEVRVLRVVIPPHCSLARHHHDIMSYAVVTKGQLTIVREADKKETTINQGEPVVETVGTVHHGENRGETTTELYVFYLSQEGLPLSVAD